MVVGNRPFVIIVYDVEQQRVAKVCQFLRRFLNWVQNSAFEGELTESQLKRLRHGLKDIIDPSKDSVYIYRLPAGTVVRKEVLGIERGETESLIE